MRFAPSFCVELVCAGALFFYFGQTAHADAPHALSQQDAKKHWAYNNPVRPNLPKVKNKKWGRNPIDNFILARLEKEKLRPSPEAERAILIRRVSLDLIGLPPTVEEVDAFVHDKSSDAYEKVVDRLLASPQYGERWARAWLDLARYADTQGYEKDNRRSIWPYRDWVIKAINADMPFTQFTIEQMAGDLLPNATSDQKVATGFHRNTMTNTEGGTDDEEFRHYAIVDRVNTTMSVWMGTTMACTQCHNHKYDPLLNKEYYQLYAFLNQTADHDADNEEPMMKLPSAALEKEIEKIRREIEPLDHEFNLQKSGELQAEWEKKLAGTNSPVAKTNLTEAIQKTLAIKPNDRSYDQKLELWKNEKALAPELRKNRKQWIELRDREKAEDGKIPRTMVMQELPKEKARETHMLIRGNFLEKGEKVSPGVPAIFHPLPKDAPMNRLTLARWLVDENNPLTARVFVNRAWEQFFGRGIVETVEDFGTQGEPPSHPELLDWMATEFMRDGWSMKRFHKLVVMSATYRQSSRVSSKLVQRDPYNRLLARGSRVRLEAEMVRDQSLAISGLLSHKLGGPSVMPPQPDGLWQMVYSSDDWHTSKGEDKYRRALYTFWRRTNPYPSMQTFDAPSREFCVTKRNRSNTPLQALTALNDPAFVEAAQGLARRIVSQKEKKISEQAQLAFRLCLARQPQKKELQRLVSLYEKELVQFKSDKKAAEKMACSELGKAPDGTDVCELAAWTVVANVLLNLDETITKS